MAYVFDPDDLHTIVCDSMGVPWPRVVDRIVADLDIAYPGHIETGERRFILRNAGGAMEQRFFLHVSPREALFVVGSPIGTEGHTGRHRAEVWDFMIRGQMWAYREGDLARSIYLPGDASYVGPYEARGYRLTEQGWMLQYVRGPILAMLPFELADSVLSTLDLASVGRTVAAYARLLVKSALPDSRRSQPGLLPYERHASRGPIAQA